LQRTALRAHKIVAFLKAGIGLTAISVDECAAADAQAGWTAPIKHHYHLKLQAELL